MAGPYDVPDPYADRVNPFLPSNALQEKQLGAANTQELLNEDFMRSIGRPADVPSEPGLSFGKRLMNAIAGQALPGFQLYASEASPSRLDVSTLSPAEQEQFLKQPKLLRLMQTAQYPGGIAALAQNPQLYKSLFADEPTVLQESVSFMHDLYKAGAPKEVLSGLSHGIMQQAVEAGALKQEDFDYAQTMVDAGYLTQDEHSDILRLAVMPATTPEAQVAKDLALRDKLGNIKSAKDKINADIAQSKASATSSYASAESAKATAATTRRGKLYRFATGAPMYDSDPEFQKRMAAGDVPLLVSSASGTEAGASDVIVKTPAAKAVSTLEQGAGSVSELRDMASTIKQHPRAVGTIGGVTEWAANFASQFSPTAANFLTSKVSGTTYPEFTQLQNRIDSYQFQSVQPIINESRFTQPERDAAKEISGSASDSPEALRAKMGNMAVLRILNQDKQTFIGNRGKGFSVPLHSEDPKESAAAIGYLTDSLRTFGFSDERIMQVTNRIYDAQEELLHLGADEVAKSFSGKLPSPGD